MLNATITGKSSAPGKIGTPNIKVSSLSTLQYLTLDTLLRLSSSMKLPLDPRISLTTLLLRRLTSGS
jgi:hypothetical protein